MVRLYYLPKESTNSYNAFLITTKDKNYRALEGSTLREVDPSQYDRKEEVTSREIPRGISRDNIEKFYRLS